MSELCTDINKLIPTYLDGELAESELHSFEHHLSDCSACADEVAQERSFLDHVRTVLATPPAPDMLRSRLGKALDAEDEVELKRTRRQQSAWILPSIATMAAAAALFVFVLDIARPAVNQNRAEADVQAPALASMSPAVSVDRNVAHNTARNTASNTASNVARNVARAGEYLNVPVRAPHFNNAQAEMRGWQPLRNRNHNAALFVYEVMHNSKSSSGTNNKRRVRIEVQMLDARNLDLRGAEPRVVRGTQVWVASAMGLNAVSLRDENGVGYVFSSRMDADSLLDLVVPAQKSRR